MAFIFQVMHIRCFMVAEKGEREKERGPTILGKAKHNENMEHGKGKVDL